MLGFVCPHFYGSTEGHAHSPLSEYWSRSCITTALDMLIYNLCHEPVEFPS